MNNITCAVPGCGLEMKHRINGSHLKSKHSLTIEQYKSLYPNANLGHYETKNFKCKVCDELISNKSEIKSRHIRGHGFETIDEYNIKNDIKLCKCGCGEIADYSFKKHKYNDFKSGHSIIWNKGLTKENDVRLKNSKSGGWNKGLTKENNIIMNGVSNKMIDYWEENNHKKSIMVNNIKKTMIEKYGVENANDYPIFWAKYKDYVFPSGKVVRVQGYENFGLDLLIKDIHENEIIVDRKKIPKFIYNGNKTYTPDFWVQKNNTIYEIKSTWTYKIFKHEKEKINAVNQAGFNYVLIVFKKNKEYEIKEHKIN